MFRPLSTRHLDPRSVPGIVAAGACGKDSFTMFLNPDLTEDR
jgi:hypothetical protein